MLVFEDVQWADAGLLDFIEYLLDWSRNQPLYVIALARPEFAEKRSTWAGKRGLHAALPRAAASARRWTSCSPASCPVCPTICGSASSSAPRACRSSPSRPSACCSTGHAARETATSTGRPAPIDHLEMPETLHALVAARLDGLTGEERRLVQDGSVLGKTFTKQGLSSLTGMDPTDLEPLLASLLRKEVLSVQADPRSPERGQYAFLQDIVKRVAYETHLAQRAQGEAPRHSRVPPLVAGRRR